MTETGKFNHRIGVIIGGVIGFILFLMLNHLTSPFIGLINGAVFGFILCLIFEVFIFEREVKQRIVGSVAGAIVSAIYFGFWIWLYVRGAPMFTNPEVLTTPATKYPDFQVPALVGLAILSFISGLFGASGGLIIGEITDTDLSSDFVFAWFILGSISPPIVFFVGEIILSPFFIIPSFAFIGYPIGMLIQEKAERRTEIKHKRKINEYKTKLEQWIEEGYEVSEFKEKWFK